MKPFLEELAETIIQQHAMLDELTIVFPNRRASLFFRNYLSGLIKKPVWSPNLITVEELFKQLSDLQEADRLSLIFRLFSVYQEIMGKSESFDKFYFWGDMLLRDFEEVDKYHVPAAQMFRDLSNWREFDDTFDALTAEQKQFLKDFWVNFGDKPVTNKEEFLKIWRQLPKIYQQFSRSLKKEGIGYEGMIHREVAGKILAGKIKDFRSNKEGKGKTSDSSHLIFAGFNALTTCEEIVFRHFSSRGAHIYWDLDRWYVDDKNQEAGQFFRQYMKDDVLGKTLEKNQTSNFSSVERKVNLYGVPQKSGQGKLVGQLIEKEIIQPRSTGNTVDEVRTVVVLPDETLLLSVLHSLPESLSSINVTMGYPLRSTPLYNLMELLVELQSNNTAAGFSHRQVTAILAHPYILSQQEATSVSLRLDIISKNTIHIPAEELQGKNPLFHLLFQVISADTITGWLLEVIRNLGHSFSDDQSFDREYAFHFHATLARFADVLKDSGSALDLKGFHKLFRQVIQAQKIPFTGVPLKGLQVMGVLETRNLDFDNVFILSLNEGSLPAAPRQGSYIPHAIRKAYGLPTHDHQDAMYAYLFYRLLQRAKNIHLIYNTEPDILGMGEMSRFVQQLVYESKWDIKQHILSNPVATREVEPIVVAKTGEVFSRLAIYTDPKGKGISPSALNDYIECRLRFYLKHVARLREANVVEEELDARVFGTFLHNIMEWFYRDLTARKGSMIVEAHDLDKKNSTSVLEELTDRAFHEHYHIDAGRKIEYIGQRVVVREIVLQFASQLLKLDHDHTPFSIELIEENQFVAPVKVKHSPTGEVLIGGRIDRADSKDGEHRVIDYKTGQDSNSFASIGSLFSRDVKRNKSAFQTFSYAWLYKQKMKDASVIQPTLMTRKNIFSGAFNGFKMGKEEITNIVPQLPEFQQLLEETLDEMFDPSVEFTQTSDERNCKFCLFKNMCRR